jgi:hypothetical protein
MLQAANRRPIAMPGRHSSTLTCCQAPFAARWTMSRLVYQVGEGFYEVPGSHHRISENASERDPASLLAVFVVDSNDTPLTIADKK